MIGLGCEVVSNVYLCGHTGSENHGSEAIIRATAKLLRLSGCEEKATLATFSPDQDIEYGVDQVVTLLPYGQYPFSAVRYLAALRRRVSGSWVPGQDHIQRRLWESVRAGDVCLNVGGDTYCYSTPVPSLALNEAMERLGVPTVLWCASLEESRITPEILSDLRKYRYIVTREVLTHDLVLRLGIAPERVLSSCDPAFNLDSSPVDLPVGFIPGNTVGINISNLVMRQGNQQDMTYRNVTHVIDHVISETDLHVCLVPHAYSSLRNRGDIVLLRNLYQQYAASGRVSLVQDDYNCEQLKYIISRCRFFIGARTHSMIAAYSSGVPAIALGYSLKSRGIAMDLFHTDKGYVLPYDALRHEDDLLEAFMQLMAREPNIKAQYAAILPKYKDTVLSALSQVLAEAS